MSEQNPNEELLINSRRLVYFAAERTLMAWIRVALAMMALGFVIDRFGLVLRQIMPPVAVALHSKALSFWGGSLMVVVGALMAVVAAVRYGLFARDYRRESSTNPGRGILQGVVFTVIVAMFGFMVAAFLLTVTD